jgi:hypothetical protein
VNLKELLGDPTWLFDLGFPIHEIPSDSVMGDPERLEWELGDDFRLPPLSSLNNEKRFAEVSIAWNDD